MSLLLLILPPLIAALLAYALTPAVRLLAFRVGAIDRPGPRKVHSIDVPRLGGLAVIASSGIVLLVLAIGGIKRIDIIAAQLGAGVVLGLLPIIAVSIRDDIRPLRALPKFAAHLLGASVAVSFGIRLNPDIHIFGAQLHLGWVAIPLSIFWLAGLTNAFNIVDGLDGLSAGLALISALSLAGVAIMVGRYELAIIALVVSGSLLGFLPYNMYPARIFLGDSGSAAIGFCLGALALRGGSTLSSGMAVLAPVVVLGVPIAETLISMIRRALAKLAGGSNGIFEADRGHFHHRLIAMGIDHRRAVLLLYGVGLVFAAAGVGSLLLSHRGAAVLLVLMVVAAGVGIGRLGYDEFAVVRSGAVLRVYDVPVLKRALFVVFVDLAVVVFAVYAAVALKYDDWQLAKFKGPFQGLVALFAGVCLLVFWGTGMYRNTWRLATVTDLVRTSTSVVIATVGAYICSHLLWADHSQRVSFFVIYGLVFLIGTNAVRASFRLLQHWSETSQIDGDAVAIYGAGRCGTMVIRETLANRDIHMKPIGFIDDDPEKLGKLVNGYPVVGSIDELEELIARGTIKGVVVATDKIPELKVKQVADICARSGTWMKQFRIEFSGDALPSKVPFPPSNQEKPYPDRESRCV